MWQAACHEVERLEQNTQVIQAEHAGEGRIGSTLIYKNTFYSCRDFHHKDKMVYNGNSFTGKKAS